jgi:hypothetical protein
MTVAGIRGTNPQLWCLVKGDFVSQSGGTSFLMWVAAIAVVGGLGYIPRLKPLSIAFMTLLLLVLVVSKQGVFAQLQQFLQSGIGSASNGIGTAPSVPVTPTSGAGLAPLSPAQQIQSNILGLSGG